MSIDYTLRDVISDVASELQTNMTDPSTPSRTRWIWAEFPNQEPDYPCVIIDGFERPIESGCGQAISEGKRGVHSLVTLTIQVKVRQGEVHSSMSDHKLVNHIYGEIAAIMSRSSTRNNIGAIYIRPLSGGLETQDFAGELLQRIAEYEVRITKSIY